MAWPTPALDDLIWTHDTGGKRWLHALCQAINERQIGLGLTQTKFVVGGGGPDASSIDVTDLTGVWVGGDRDGAITNLNRCMVALKAMLTQTTYFGTVGSFLQSAGYGATAWSLSSIQTDVGLGTFPTGTDRFTDLNFWKQIQEALDRMTICRKISVANSGTLKRRQSAIADPDLEVAWDTARGLSGSTVSWSGSGGWDNENPQVGWFFGGFESDPFGGVYDVELRSDGSTTFVNGCVGTLDEAYYVISARASATSSPAWEVEHTSGSPFSVSDTFSGHVLSSDLVLGSSNATTYTATTTPTDHPATIYNSIGGYPPGGAVSGYWAALDMQYADFYFQPTLTDQA